MPKVTRQRPAKKKVARKKSTGLLSQAIDVGEMEESPLRVLIYGPNRAGKTYLACSFAKPLVIVSFEPVKSGGARSVQDFKGVKLLRLRSTKEAIELTEELADSTYKTVVVDSATSLQDVVLTEILELDEVPVSLKFGTVTTDQYRERSEVTREVLRKYLNLPMDVIITAKEKDHNPPLRNEEGKLDFKPKMIKPLQMESFIAADVGGATAGFLNDACDYIFRIYKDEEVKPKKVKIGKVVKTSYVKTGRYVRHLLVDYHPNYAGGCRLGANRSAMPEDGIITNPTPEDILKLVRG